MSNFKKSNSNYSAKKPVKDTSWGKVATWYDDLLESGKGTYQSDLILPNVIRLLELKRGEKVLDLACGQGFFTREIFKSGASVVGADISKELIDLAKKQSSKEINFTATPADRLGFLTDSSLDAILCVLAIQNIKNVSGVFTECSRVLKTGGRMLFVLNHPAFRVPKRSSWGFDSERRIQYRRVDEYISESETGITMNPGLNASLRRVGRTNSSNEFVLGSNVSVATVSFHHPFQFYFKILHKTGFVVSRLEEWTSNKQSEPGPNAGAENKARNEFPLFLAIEVKKL